MQYLGETLDIHCGGTDHIPVHNTNEIAQSECATDKQFARFWLHGAFLITDKEKMSKSSGGFLKVDTLIEKGYDPLAYRFLCLMAHDYIDVLCRNNARCCGNHMGKQRLTANLVQNLGALRLQTRPFTRGHNDDGEWFWF